MDQLRQEAQWDAAKAADQLKELHGVVTQLQEGIVASPGDTTASNDFLMHHNYHNSHSETCVNSHAY